MTETCRNRTPEPKEAEKSVRLLAEANEIDGSTAVCPSLKGTGGAMARGKQNQGCHPTGSSVQEEPAAASVDVRR